MKLDVWRPNWQGSHCVNGPAEFGSGSESLRVHFFRRRYGLAHWGGRRREQGMPPVVADVREEVAEAADQATASDVERALERRGVAQSLIDARVGFAKPRLGGVEDGVCVGDRNPIPHDGEFARAAGIPTVFAVGMLPAGILASYVADWLGSANIRPLRVQYREQARPGDVLTYCSRGSPGGRRTGSASSTSSSARCVQRELLTSEGGAFVLP